MDRRKLRTGYAVLFLVLFTVEALIALYVRDALIRPYVGDMLVVVLIYFFVRIFLPTGCRLLPLYVFLFAACVEGLQYFHLVERLGLEGNRVARIIIGSVFDWKDIGCYAAGCVVIGIWEWLGAAKFMAKFMRSRP